MATDENPAARAIFKDVAKVYCGVLALIIVAAVLAQFVGIIGQMLYAIVALLFFLVPERLIERRGEDPADYAIHRGNTRKGIVYGLAATLLTLPFFIPGYWVWEKYGLQREFDPDVGRYRQWSSDVSGEPKDWGKKEAGVWIWSEKDVIHVGVANDGSPNNRVRIEADQPFTMQKRGTIVLKPLNADDSGASNIWELALTHSRSRGVVTIRGPTDLKVRTIGVVEANPVWPIYKGPDKTRVDGGAFEDSRGIWWLLLWLATQVLLVALPEEVFYRGFIQTRLEQGFAARGTNGSWLGFTPAIFVTSLLFGIGHLLVPVGGVLIASRMSVFFPSLIFGWLRRRTDSVLASTIYHAFSNTMVLVAAVHFT